MSLKHTAFFNKHNELGAKIVPFAGYEMPVQYPTGIIAEHKCVRESVGVFDVSHMGEVIIRGENALEYINYITINDASTLTVGQAQYTAMCYEDGGIVDDLLVYKFEDYYLLVINASNIEKDVEWMLKHKMDAVEIINISDDYSQLAVQGQNAEAVLQKLTDINLADIKYYFFVEGNLAGENMIISRTGYTGESGFELYFKNSETKPDVIWNKIFEAGEEFGILPIGLGARDSLRLEKKMALYGNDIDQSTNPIEAGLGWISKVGKENFIGKEPIAKMKEEKPSRRLVSLLFNDEKAFPRQGYDVVDNDGNAIGKITSGTRSPILEQGIAMAYVPRELASEGTEHKVQIRKKIFTAKVVKGAFL
jgi:aminomethyltransferase